MQTNQEVVPFDPYLQRIQKNILHKLPRDIVVKIYKDYLEPEVYYEIYKRILQSPECANLNGNEMRTFIPIILSKPIVCKYIITKCVYFRSSYEEHKIKQDKSFVNLKKGDSFVAVILMHRYH